MKLTRLFLNHEKRRVCLLVSLPLLLNILWSAKLDLIKRDFERPLIRVVDAATS